MTTMLRTPIEVESESEFDDDFNTIVIGMDTDTNGFHYIANREIWDGSGDQEEPDKYGFVVCSGHVEARRGMTYLHARNLFKALPTDCEVHVFCEEALSLQNGKTNRLLAMATGAIWAAWIEAGGLKNDREWHWVDVAHWKKSVIGRGTPPKDFIYVGNKSNRTKAWIRDFCLHNERFCEEWLTKRGTEPWMFAHNWNLYDAWCLKVFGIQELYDE
jgi:hypothetical protein